MGDEVVGALVHGALARRELPFRFALALLPLGRSEPGLLGVDRPADDPAQENTRAVNRKVRQLVDELVELRLGHRRIVA